MKAEFLCPVVTIFDEQGNLDTRGTGAVYDHLIDGGIDGIVVLGSTGEFYSMPMAMQKELIAFALQHINRRTRVLVGTSRMCAKESTELANFAHEKGADGVMIVSPYYFALPNESIAKFYSEIASNTQASIYLYNFPARTGYSLSPELVLSLARKHNNIVGIKDTVEGMDHTRELIEAIKPELPEFIIYSGYDENFVHNILSGGSGCIGGLSNLVPDVCSSWVRACERNDCGTMASLQKYINGLMDLYGISTPFIPTMKKALMLKGLPIQDHCLAPVLPISEAQTEKVRVILKKAKLIS